MASVLSMDAVRFLRDLGEHNEREWFQANKKRYEAALKGPLQALAAEVNEGVRAISPDHALDDPRRAVSRINRDTRFSADKSPYTTHLRVGFHDADRPQGTSAGFYFGISPLGIGVGCGVWLPPPSAMEALRRHIDTHPGALEAALAAVAGDYPEVHGERYKRVPKPWAADHPAAELLKHKGLYIKTELGLTPLDGGDPADAILDHFRRIAPVLAFIHEGLAC